MATDFSTYLKELGLSQAEFCRLLSKLSQKPADENQVSRWARGTQKPSKAVVALLEVLRLLPDKTLYWLAEK